MRETELSAGDFIYPMFLLEGNNRREAIHSMPGIERFSLDLLAQEVETLQALRIPAIALFPNISQAKTLDGQEAFNPDGLIPTAVRF